MQMTPLIAVHMTAAALAVATGPVALWARMGRVARPRLHRAFGYAWVTLIVVTAITALFIRDHGLPNIDGYTPIHLLIPVTLGTLFASFWMLAHGRVAAHRRIMQRLYILACIVTGLFTLLPQRYLGQFLWSHVPLAAVGIILRHTPLWVWGLLAGLVVLGASHFRDRTTSLARVSLLPASMTVFSAWGIFAVLGGSPVLAQVLGTWLAAAVLLFALVARGSTAAR